MNRPPSFLRPCRPPLALALACTLLTGCEPPPVEPTADVRQQQALSRIEGQVVVQGSVRGNAIVLLYDATRPPPPLGTGRPVSFTVVPREQLFGPADAAATGPFTAPYALSLVPAGSYLVRGFIDAESCPSLGSPPCRGPDFIPWFTVTGEPNEGDVGGAVVDAQRQPRVVEISAQEGGTLRAATQMNISFVDSLGRVPFDRPAFSVEGLARFDRTTSMKRLELKPQVIREGVVDERPARFFVRLADDNGDGQPEDNNKDGQLDVWPRVVVRKLADGTRRDDVLWIADENDLDRNGVLDETGVDYVRENGSRDGQPDLVVLAASLELGPEVTNNFKKSSGAWNFDPIPVNSLSVVVMQQAFDARPPGPSVRLQTVPAGRYALSLIQFTGQTWRVPNELALEGEARRALPSVPSQDFALEIP